MKQMVFLMALAFAVSSCERSVENPRQPSPEPPKTQPEMTYIDLGNVTVGFGQAKGVDLTADGQPDLIFGTVLVGDPILKRDRRQYTVVSAQKRNLLNDATDQTPALHQRDGITAAHPGYLWWDLSSIVLAEKIVTYTNTFWQGNWKDAGHRYLPIQIDLQGKKYHGWVELSLPGAEEKIILHRAAVSKVPDVAVMAGL
ncbi:hypothetical protein [Flavihumibacter petaseus]|nr:hypothetical protein [Flavihumibacter petaseus]